ncbi:TcaA NTF2-like domain-containing protein [Salibacterium lacus]|uniref:Zinc ribbon domain-containing protein n=1 Tax=Salibacterium lacus TaxID=1898109 RepID=A0ABW5T6M9_9BACI
MNCNHCDQPIKNNARFCSRCGMEQDDTVTKEQKQSWSAKKKGIIFLSSLAAVIILFAAHITLSRMYAPENAVAELNEALYEQDESIENVITPAESSVTWNTEIAKGYKEFLLNEVNESQIDRYLNEVKQAAHGDFPVTFTTNGHDVLQVHRDGRFAGIYPSYEIQAIPYDIYVNSNIRNISVSLEDKEMEMSERNQDYKLARVYPSVYEGTATFESEFSKGSMEFVPDFSQGHANEIVKDLEWEADYLNVEAADMDAPLYVDGENTGMSLQEAVGEGPVLTDGSVTVSSKFDTEYGSVDSNEVTLQNTGEAWLEADEEQLNELEQAASSQEVDSNQSLEDFVESYLEISVKSMNEGDFSIVEDFHDPDGVSYQESKDYVDYIYSEGIQEELEYGEVVGYEKNGDMYTVDVEDAYTIYKEDGTVSYQEFESTFAVKEENGRYYINELTNTEEVHSEEIN